MSSIKLVLVAVLCTASLGMCQEGANLTQTDAVSKLDFLVGHWRTESTFVASGNKAPGDLRYSKVLGGAWILCEFKGDVPGRVWEAIAMITFDPEAGHYRSYAFFGGAAPAVYTGEFVAENSVCFTDGAAGNRITYSGRPDGTVFQLNEAVDESGEWRPTLETAYTPRQ